jgi:hypothetical protein
MAEIIQLEQFRRSVRSPGGVWFPTVHRIIGCAWDGPKEGPINFEDLTPDPTWPYRYYSLSPDAPVQLANLASEPITRLDPTLDHGWVIVRHHRDLDLAHAYLDGLDDGEEKYEVTVKQWRTTEGIFTLHHRETRHRCRDCLLIYATSERTPGLAAPWCHIVASDGSIFSDPDILIPDDL